MEDLIRDLPLPVNFEHREQVSETVAGPVVKFQPHGGDRADDIDTGDPCLEFRRRTVLVILVKELLDGTSEQVVTDIAEDCSVLVKGGLHVVASARPGSIDIMLDGLGDRIIIAHVGRCIAHRSHSSSGCGLKGFIYALLVWLFKQI